MFWAVFMLFALVQSARGSMSLSLLDAAWLSVWVAATSAFGFWAGRRQISFLSDQLCSVMGFFKKRVRYANIAAISLVDLIGEHVFLSFELLEPRDSPVKKIAIPRANCREILLILAREAPQAKWDELSAQWRDEGTS